MALAATALVASGVAMGWTLRQTAVVADATPDVTTVPVRLALHAPDARSVAVAGTWNAWAPESMAPTRSDDGSFHIVLMVPQGRHEYMFLVDGSTWVVDPKANLTSDDDFGMANSILDV